MPAMPAEANRETPNWRTASKLISASAMVSTARRTFTAWRKIRIWVGALRARRLSLAPISRPRTYRSMARLATTLAIQPNWIVKSATNTLRTVSPVCAGNCISDSAIPAANKRIM